MNRQHCLKEPCSSLGGGILLLGSRTSGLMEPKGARGKQTSPTWVSDCDEAGPPPAPPWFLCLLLTRGSVPWGVHSEGHALPYMAQLQQAPCSWHGVCMLGPRGPVLTSVPPSP